MKAGAVETDGGGTVRAMRARRRRHLPECLVATGILVLGVALGVASPQPDAAAGLSPVVVGGLVSSVVGGVGGGVSVTTVDASGVVDGGEAGALGRGGIAGGAGGTDAGALGGAAAWRLPDLFGPTGPWAVSGSAAALAVSGAPAGPLATPTAPPGAATGTAGQALSVLPPAGIRISVPEVLWTAYARAVGGVRAGCHLPVTLLAAIGHVESRSLAGRSLTVTHDVVPPVLGPVLSGGAFAAIRDTDGGRLDGDTGWDRAVGPMQFIPGTWRVWGRDGNGDGVANPQNVEDAALSAATYLCAGGRDLSDPAQLRAAVLSYNNSSSYVAAVLGLMGSMTSGGSPVPGAVGPAVRVTVTAPPVTVTAPPVTVTAPPVTATVTATITATARPTATRNPPVTVTQTVTVTATPSASTTTTTTTTTTSTARKADPATSTKPSTSSKAAATSSTACDVGSGGTSTTTGTPAPPTTTGC